MADVVDLGWGWGGGYGWGVYCYSGFQVVTNFFIHNKVKIDVLNGSLRFHTGDRVTGGGDMETGSQGVGTWGQGHRGWGHGDRVTGGGDMGTGWTWGGDMGTGSQGVETWGQGHRGWGHGDRVTGGGDMGTGSQGVGGKIPRNNSQRRHYLFHAAVLAGLLATSGMVISRQETVLSCLESIIFRAMLLRL